MTEDIVIEKAQHAKTEAQEPSAGTGPARAALVAAMLGFFVVALDAQIVNVALPDVRHSLGGGLSGLQWVVTGYTLMFSALQLFAGSFSDRVGARSAYGTGMMLFIAASAACGAAAALPMLVVSRVVQGLGAAMITPTSLALIRDAYTDTRARGRAIAYWALGGSVAAAAGPVIGGLLTQVDWRLIFFVNLPVGVAALGVLTRVPVSPRWPASFDWTGQISAVLALAGLTFGIIEGAPEGYGSLRVVIGFAVAVLGAMVFVAAQARGRHPMVPLDVFRSSTVATSLGLALVTMAAFYGVVFVQSIYFQQQRGQSALLTGLLFLPMTALVAALNPLVARLMERIGRIPTTLGGTLLMAGGLIGLALLSPTTPLWGVAVMMAPVGVGGSFTVPPLTALVMDAIPAERAGTPAGVLNTARQMGGSIGVAIFGAVLATQSSFQTGLQLDTAVTGVLLIVLAGATVRLRREH